VHREVILDMVFNAQATVVSFVLPDAHPGSGWIVRVDTAVAGEPDESAIRAVGAALELTGRSLQLLQAVGQEATARPHRG
jgi:hypothetical protein